MTTAMWAVRAGLLLPVVMVLGCSGDKESEDTGSSSTDTDTATDTSTDTGDTSTDTGDTGDTGDAPYVQVDGFSTPESVLYDATNDVYYVSNINGAADEKDDNGFISKVLPDGTIEALAFIDGASEEVELHAPKGMAILDGVLYVTDIDVVRTFDLSTGAPIHTLSFVGASFLNDITPARAGGAYVTDTNANAIFYVRSDGTTEVLVQGTEELIAPNGIYELGSHIYVVSYAGGGLLDYNDRGELVETTVLTREQLDGIVVDNFNRILISYWDGNGVMRQRDDLGNWGIVVSSVEAPADIGYDSLRNRVLVPSFTGDSVVFVSLDTAE